MIVKYTKYFNDTIKKCQNTNALYVNIKPQEKVILLVILNLKERHLDLINRRQYSEDVIDYEAKYNELIIRYDRIYTLLYKNLNINLDLNMEASVYQDKYKEIEEKNKILESDFKGKIEVIEVLKSIIRPLPIRQPIYIEEECEND